MLWTLFHRSQCPYQNRSNSVTYFQTRGCTNLRPFAKFKTDVFLAGNFPQPRMDSPLSVVGSGCCPPKHGPPPHLLMIREFFLGKTELGCSGFFESRYTSHFAESVSGIVSKPSL